MFGIGACRRGLRGFTLIEVLIVIVIIAILMAIALPLYLGIVTQSEITSCRANMQTLANAEQSYRGRNPNSHNYTTILSDLNPDLVLPPVCVRGGNYSVTISDGSQTANDGSSVPP